MQPVLVRIGFARLHDANQVIGKNRVTTRQRNPGHVAAYTIRFADRTAFDRRRARRCWLPVASQALRIVRNQVVVGLLMWIVARETADARVVANEAFAEF